MSGRVLSRPEVQPAEVPARVAPARVPAGRVPAAKVSASGVSASASVLRLCGREEADHGQQNRKDARRPHKEGSSSGHGLPTPGNSALFYSGSGGGGYSASAGIRFKALFWSYRPDSSFGISPTERGNQCTARAFAVEFAEPGRFASVRSRPPIIPPAPKDANINQGHLGSKGLANVILAKDEGGISPASIVAVRPPVVAA